MMFRAAQSICAMGASLAVCLVGCGGSADDSVAATPIVPTVVPTSAPSSTPDRPMPSATKTTTATASPTPLAVATATGTYTATAMSTGSPTPTPALIGTPSPTLEQPPARYLDQVQVLHTSARRFAVSPDGRHVYVANGQLAIFERDAGTGTLTFIPGPVLSGFGGLVASPDGRHLYVFSTAGLLVLERESTSGQLTFVEVIPPLSAERPDGVEGLGGAAALAVSPDGRHVYVTGNEAMALVFERDEVSGRLAFVELRGLHPKPSHQAGAGLNVGVSPDGRNLYITERTDDRLSSLGVFDRDPATGRLILVEEHNEGDPGIRGLDAVAVSPDGANVYAGGIGGDFKRFLTAFRREPSSGKLTPVGFVELSGLYSLAVAPSGSSVYAASAAGLLVVLERDPEQDALDPVELEEVPTRTVWVAVSPDGTSVYAGGDSGLVVFRVR